MSKMQHHSYTFSFLLIFLIFRCTISKSTLSSTESLTISSNTTLVSPGDKFELGFFKPSSSNSRWYLGIWYKIISDRTYIWVANRDTPLSNAIGTLKLLNTNLLLLDHSDTPVWSTNMSRVDVKSPLVAELLANGNFVIRYSGNKDPSRFLWQSFDFPTDTLLPQMELGKDLKTGFNRFLTAWKSPSDPSSGNFSYKLKIQGCPEFFIYDISSPIYRSGPWDGAYIVYEKLRTALDFEFVNT